MNALNGPGDNPIEALKGLNMQTKTEHTKTPWIHDSEFEGTLIKDLSGQCICEVDLPKIRELGYDICAGIQQANAQHIVKCVNCHDELVTALEVSLSAINNPNGNCSSIAKQTIQQALKKAGE